MVFRYAGRNVCAANTDRSRAFYNLIGKFYDWLYADQILGYRQVVQHLVDQYVQPEESVLDVGCGTGLLLELVQEKAGYLVGIDISLGMLKQAGPKLQGSAGAHLIAADCRALPLRKTFDKIVSSFMLVILPYEDQKRVIASLASLLSDRGALVFLSAREDFSPEWLSKDCWRDVCSQAGLNRIQIVDLYDYYRIVIADRTPTSCEENRIIETDLVAPVASQS